jgi:hypothetical protein
MPKRIAKATARVISRAVQFIVGRSPAGGWVVVEAGGRGGGIFRSREDALHYAEFESGHRPGAVRVTRRPVALRF